MLHTPRLFVNEPLNAGAAVRADEAQAHHMLHVLRLGVNDAVLLFNGCDGEWHARVTQATKRICLLTPHTQTRPQTLPDDVHYLFAPLKTARLDYMVQKAAELGVARLQPVRTQHTQVSAVKVSKLRGYAVEAAQQCGGLHVPQVDEMKPLDALLDAWPPQRALVMCDEMAPPHAPLGVLQALKGKPCAVLVGPEGGFSAYERERLLRLPVVHPISLGPQVLRADTAGVAALAMLWLARASKDD